MTDERAAEAQRSVVVHDVSYATPARMLPTGPGVRSEQMGPNLSGTTSWRSVPRPGTPVRVSVICITARPEPGLGRLLKSLTEQTFPHHEFELVYGDRLWESREAEVKAVLMDSGLNWVYVRDKPTMPGPCPAGARNTCVERSHGDWIISIDDLTYLPKDLIQSHVVMMEAGFDAVCGSYLTLKEDAVSRHDIRWGRESVENEDSRVTGAGGAAEMSDQLIHLSWWGMHMGFSKSAWSVINGFDERFDGVYGMEDIDFGHRLRGAGMALAWCPELKVLCERGSRHNDTHVQLLDSKRNAPTSWFRGVPVWRNDKLVYYNQALNVVRGARGGAPHE